MFVHLHVHSHYSFGDALCSPEDLVKGALEQGVKHVALTDHGYMCGVLDFYKAARKAGVNPIIGLEAYFTPREAGGKELGAEERSYYTHLTLLAKNNTGYRNLLKLASFAATEGMYYNPTIDINILREYSEGLICLSGCFSGLIPKLLRAGERDKAEEWAKKFHEIFGEDFYLEVQKHPITKWSEIPRIRAEQEKFAEGQRIIYEGLLHISSKLGIPMVATNDVHYMTQDQSDLHDIYLAVGDGKKVFDESRRRYSTDQFYFKSEEEMLELFPADMVHRTLEIAEKCNVVIEEFENPKPLMPHFPKLPAGKTEAEYLRSLVYEGLAEKGLYDKPGYYERANEELATIIELGWPGYFLILWDIMKFCEEEGIPTGPSRGSAGGSLVSYALNITKIDPVKHNLLFSRFLNKHRQSPPDIDTDVSRERRGEVIEYIARTYGKDRTIQIGANSILKAKSAVKAVATAFGVEFDKANRLTDLIPDTETPLGELKDLPDIKEMCKDPELKKVVEIAEHFQDKPSHFSVHAAGVIIAPDDVTKFCPVRMKDGAIIAQWHMKEVEKIGLLKMDILGLKTLDVIDHTLREIERNRGIKIKVGDIPMDDPRTYELLGRADTLGVFQLESSLAQGYLKKMKPKSFVDVENFVALIRPGPLDAPAPSGQGTMVDEFIRRMHGQARVVPLHETTAHVLEDTYQIVVFQEQAMRITQAMAGFTEAEADNFRRAIAKKVPEEMPQLRKMFVEGCLQNGIPEKEADDMFNILETFSGYGFNKSHACGYAVLAVQTAWLRANYHPEFMAALLTSVKDDSEKLAQYLRDCYEHKTRVLPPSINISTDKFVADGDAVRFGLNAIKNVGNAATLQIIEERAKNGKFSSFADFIKRAYGNAVNKTVLERLALTGVFDDFGLPRAGMAEIIPDVIKATNSYNGKIKRIEDKESSFVGISDIAQLEKERAKLEDRRKKAIAEYEKLLEEAVQKSAQTKELNALKLAQAEKEFLGLYLTYHPMDHYKEYYASLAQCPQILVNSHSMYEHVNKNVVTCGYVSKVARSRISTGYKIELTLDDLYGTMTVIAYNKEADTYKDVLKEGNVITVIGRVVHFAGNNTTYIKLLEAEGSQEEPLRPKVIIYTEAKHAREVAEEVDRRLAPPEGELYDYPPRDGEMSVSIYYPYMGETREIPLKRKATQDDLKKLSDVLQITYIDVV